MSTPITGVSFTPQYTGGSKWREKIFDTYRQKLLDLLAAGGENYANSINEMQRVHSQIYNEANQHGNWQQFAYKSPLVQEYQKVYRGDSYLGSQAPPETIDFNLYGINNSQDRYDVSGPTRTSGDSKQADGYYSAITDDRRLLGRKGDWNENSEEFKNWLNQLKSLGYTMYLDPNDNYYRLLPIEKASVVNLSTLLGTKPTEINVDALRKSGSLEESHEETSGKKTKLNLNALSDILEAGRLASTLSTNDKIYNAQLKGLKPNLQQSFDTHRQIVGDESGKQAYYKRAALTLAIKSVSSDMDRQMAYKMEAQRIANTLRAEGDKIDNAEIRRTSDESLLHQMQNAARRNLVANSNSAQINATNAARASLLAQKYAAELSTWDNYLKGKETRLRAKEAEKEALRKQILALLQQDALASDPNLLRLKKAASDAIDTNAADAMSKVAAYRQALRRLQIQQLEDLARFAKRGTKLTYTKKDDLLYKSAKDVVEHFRKMSELSSKKSTFKPLKLSFPKKMQQGGVAPFTVFTPAVLGGGTSAVSDTTSSSTKKEKTTDDSLDFAKSLFQKVDGLPIDVNNVTTALLKTIRKAEALGDTLSTSDLASMYLQSILLVAALKHSKEVYNEAKTQIIKNDAMDSVAVTSGGQYVVQDLSGKIFTATLLLIKEKKLNPLTNGQLINMRETSPNMAFGAGDLIMEVIVHNGVGLSKIAEQIKALRGNIGSSESTIEGFTRNDSRAIREGMNLLAEAPPGTYKYTLYTKELRNQIAQAYNYIVSMLPTNMKAVLDIHAYAIGTTPKAIIESFLSSGSDVASKLEFSSAKGSSDSSSSSSGGSEEAKLDAPVALIEGVGYSAPIEFNPGTSYAITVNGRYTEFLNHSGENMGLITMKEALTSTLKGVLDFNKATLGGSRLNSMAYNTIVISNGEVVGVDLPVGSDKNTPDFSMLKKLQALDLELLKRGIKDSSENFLEINKICESLNLPPKYTNNGQLNTQNWNRFAAFQVIADENALLDKNAILEDIVATADEATRDNYELYLQSRSETKDYGLSGGIFGLGKTELYKGTVFVPVKSSLSAALLSGGQKTKMDSVTDYELRDKGYDVQKAGTYQKKYNLSDLNE